MKIKVLGSSVGGAGDRHFAASYVVDGSVAIDAGSIGMIASLGEQRNIEHVFLSHCHMDHIATLPGFLDNVYREGPDCPTVYGSEFVRDVLSRDVFNGRVWPDVFHPPSGETPFLRFQVLEDRTTIAIKELRVTCIPLDHVVPSFGFIVEDAESAVAFVSDTSPTEEIWATARKKENLAAVFLEASFPNRMTELAKRTGHLTPAMFFAEHAKLGRDIPFVAVHIKPAFHEEVVDDLSSLGLSTVTVARPEAEYEF